MESLVAFFARLLLESQQLPRDHHQHQYHHNKLPQKILRTQHEQSLLSRLRHECSTRERWLWLQQRELYDELIKQRQKRLLKEKEKILEARQKIPDKQDNGFEELDRQKEGLIQHEELLCQTREMHNICFDKQKSMTVPIEICKMHAVYLDKQSPATTPIEICLEQPEMRADSPMSG